MSMLEIGEGIKTRLQTIHGLKVYSCDELPDSINQFPAALILPGETAYVTALSSTDADYNFRIILVFSRADSPSTTSKMLPYIGVEGEKSVVEAIHGDATLDSKADTSKVTRNLGISSLTWGGQIYMSTEFSIQVWSD
jgi:hypothetical protein